MGQLPPSLQLEVLTKHREQQAQLNRARFQEASKSAEGFSSLQMSSYIKQTELRRKMEAVRASSGNGSGNRMASKAGGHFVLEDHAEGVFLDLLAPYTPYAVPHVLVPATRHQQETMWLGGHRGIDMATSKLRLAQREKPSCSVQMNLHRSRCMFTLPEKAHLNGTGMS